MGTLNISDDTLGEVAEMARSSRVAVDDQAEALIREALDRRRADREALIERLNAVAAMTPKDRPQTDSTILLREDRDGDRY